MRKRLDDDNLFVCDICWALLKWGPVGVQAGHMHVYKFTFTYLFAILFWQLSSYSHRQTVCASVCVRACVMASTAAANIDMHSIFFALFCSQDLNTCFNSSSSTFIWIDSVYFAVLKKIFVCMRERANMFVCVRAALARATTNEPLD